jgi:hypothetical protein
MTTDSPVVAHPAHPRLAIVAGADTGKVVDALADQLGGLGLMAAHGHDDAASGWREV